MSEPGIKPVSEPLSETGSVATGPAEAGRQPAIRVILMPKDTNALGTIFGGIILSYIDQAGAVEAHSHAASGRFVTVAMREVVFHHPVFVGDLVSFYTETLKRGNTSVTVKVVVAAERARTRGNRVKVTEAEVVYVHVDEGNRPLPLPAVV